MRREETRVSPQDCDAMLGIELGASWLQVLCFASMPPPRSPKTFMERKKMWCCSKQIREELYDLIEIF